MMAIIFTFKHIGNMNFDNRNSDRANSIGNGNGSVRVSSAVEHNTVVGKSNFVNFINQSTFCIRLEIIQLRIREKCFKFLKIGTKSLITINSWFTFPQQIQVWSVYNLNS